MSVNLFSRVFPAFGGRLEATVGVLSCRWSSTSTSSSKMSAFPIRTPSVGSPKPRLGLSRRRVPNRQRLIEEQKVQGESRVFERFLTRNWKAGDVYAPHDLSPAEMRKWMKRYSPSSDAFDALGINPLHQYKNFSIMSEYMTPMGRIKHRKVTGLRPVNQRKIAKAIRRAVGVGLMPSVHRHPEVLAKEAKSRLDAGRAA